MMDMLDKLDVFHTEVTVGQLQEFINSDATELILLTQDYSQYKEGYSATYKLIKLDNDIIYAISSHNNDIMDSFKLDGDMNDIENVVYEIGMSSMCSLQNYDGNPLNWLKSQDTYAEMTAKGFKLCYSHACDRNIWVDLSKPIPSGVEL